jgi:superfamily II DNA/RNA helicase
MIGHARIGTGNTLAFGIPIMDKILSYNEKNGFVSLSHVEFF